MNSTNLLTQEHKLILRALDVLDAMIEAQGRFDEDDVATVLDFLRWFADAHHQAKEETILFPALKACTQEERSVHHMLFEHDQERQSIEDLETNLRLGQFSQFAVCANRLSSKLRNHIYKEDTLLFPAAESLLSVAQDHTLEDKLQRFDTTLDKVILAQKLQELRSLEWKYLRRSAPTAG